MSFIRKFLFRPNETGDGLRLAQEVAQLEKVVPPITRFYPGDRVRAKSGSFNAGCAGTVEFMEPGGFDPKVWVLRDRTDGPVYYSSRELILIERGPYDDNSREPARWSLDKLQEEAKNADPEVFAELTARAAKRKEY